MEIAVIIAFGAALAAGGMAAGVAFSAKSLTHWVLVVGMVLLAAESLCVGLSEYSLLPEQAMLWQQWRMLMLSAIPGVWLVFSIVYARENPRKLLERSQWVWMPALLLPVIVAVLFHDGVVSAVAELHGDSWLVALGPTGLLMELWVLLGGILILMNLERTYRAAVGTMKWRIKFMIIGIGLLFALRAFTASQGILFRSIALSLQTVNSIALLIACGVVARTLLRTGHFEVGIYASQSVLHSSFTVLLAGVYLVLLGAAAKLTERLGGESSFEFKAFLVLIALVLLFALLLSDRVRLVSRRFISRHFEKPLYDYRAIWRKFTERTMQCVDQKGLADSIAALICEVFQTLSVGVWLVADGRKSLTLISSSGQGKRMMLEGAEAEEVIGALSGKSDPIDIDGSKEPWAAVLRRCYPASFPHGGRRICVPVTTGKAFLGCIVVADRVGGISYSIQDFELLKAISDQSAASLLNLQLSEKLSQAKQLEAFQAMSAFFVHDLKNTASMLALMLKNFPLHYQNLEFREDALRGISKTVAHINELIERLNMLRHEVEVRAVECDLNKLVSEALQPSLDAPGVEVVQELGTIPKLKVDANQIEKVLTNLVLNARHAVGGHGQIKIQTSRRNGWVVLGVTDTGCGMSPEFIRNSLFRPFQSTKKEGLGIGMFHCRMIVEAHQGQIEVESKPGVGTSFRVLLPIQKS